jgi:hypothetical protein
MIKINKRKEITNNIFIFFEKKLFQITKDNNKSGYITMIFHYSIIFIIFNLLFSKNTNKFYSGTILWTIITFFHLFFNGCIFIRLERYLWKDSMWVGPWNIILYISENIFKIRPKNNMIVLKLMYFFSSLFIYSYILNRIG